MADMSDEHTYTEKENILYLLHNWFDWDRLSVVLSVLRIPILILIPIVTAFIPKLIIDCIMQKVSIGELIGVIAVCSVVLVGLQWSGAFLASVVSGNTRKIRMHYQMMAFHKILHMDYARLENKTPRQAYEEAKQFFVQKNALPASQGFYEMVLQLCVNTLGIFTFLFVLSSLKPFILGLILVTCVFDYLFLIYLRKREKETNEGLAVLTTKFDYLYRKANDFSAGKEIRIYQFDNLFDSFITSMTSMYTKMIGKLTRQTVEVTVGQALLSMLREGICYAYLIYCVLKQGMIVSDFIFYFGIITGFSAWLLGMTAQINNIKRAIIECDKFRKFIDLPDLEHGEGRSLQQAEASKKDTILEMRNVTFSYPGSKEPVIKNMSLAIKKGENIAIVGENGAGKTTVVKLLCGLYEIESGTLLLQGKGIQSYDRSEIYAMFSAVFQDYFFLPKSIETNISLCDDSQTDHERVDSVLRQVGLYQKIMSLPSGKDTMMIKQVYQDAVQFSGGELQRLLLARALYKKNASILVLDEPTAALDPIAENELYENFSEMTWGKTSIYISHRLASTRFCDRIFFIQDGMVVEAGTHEELMQKKGYYWRMFELQSYYYQEQLAGEEAL